MDTRLPAHIIVSHLYSTNEPNCSALASIFLHKVQDIANVTHLLSNRFPNLNLLPWHHIALNWEHSIGGTFLASNLQVADSLEVPALLQPIPHGIHHPSPNMLLERGWLQGNRMVIGYIFIARE
jgi:hypothetical protein